MAAIFLFLLREHCRRPDDGPGENTSSSLSATGPGFFGVAPVETSAVLESRLRYVETVSTLGRRPLLVLLESASRTLSVFASAVLTDAVETAACFGKEESWPDCIRPEGFCNAVDVALVALLLPTVLVLLLLPALPPNRLLNMLRTCRKNVNINCVIVAS
jgi:hypothetical protein